MARQQVNVNERNTAERDAIAPANKKIGDLILNTDTNNFEVWNGSAWASAGNITYPGAKLLYIREYGSDTTGNGSEENPYRTGTYAQTTFSDESVNNVYLFDYGAGFYIEDHLLMPFRPNINVIGIEYETFIESDDFSGLLFEYSVEDAAASVFPSPTYQNFSVSDGTGILISPKAGSYSPLNTPYFPQVIVKGIDSGNFKFTGTGYDNGFPDTVVDQLIMDGCASGFVQLSAVSATLHQCFSYDRIRVDSVGTDGTSTGLVSTFYASATGIVRIFDNAQVNSIGSTVNNTVRLNGTACSYLYDADGYPISGGFQFFTGSTAAQVNKFTPTNAAFNPTVEALVTPHQMVWGDEMVYTNLTVPGAVTVNLPPSAEAKDGYIVRIIDGAGDAGANNITATPDGADTIVSGVISTNNGSKTWQLFGTNWNLIASA